MNVLYFSRAAELAGCREEQWHVNSPLSVDGFWREALRRHPELSAIQPQCRIASGGDYLSADAHIDPNKETAVIPPVSGG